MLISKAVKKCFTFLGNYRVHKREARIRSLYIRQGTRNGCVIGATRTLYRFLTGKELSTEVAARYIQAECDGESIAEGGAKFCEAVRAMRKMGIPFCAENINTMAKTNRTNWRLSRRHRFKTTRRLEGKMLLVSDETRYTGAHALLIYRSCGELGLFDSALVGGVS